MSKGILALIFLLNSFVLFGQTVYKTPSGKKYHSATCRFVKNVSNSLSINEAKQMGLSACSICNPGSGSKTNHSSGLGIRANEAKGQLSTAVQCKGQTKSGQRCKRKTKNVNGYCFQHER